MEEQQYKLLDGKAVSAQMKQEMAEEVARIKAAGGKIPHLAAILVGHDGGSETYVASKVKTCNEIGFKSSLIRYEADVTEEELLHKVDELNNDPDVDGFIVQLPLPKHISEQKIIEAIDYRKDVDGFHPINVGRMSIGLPCFVSATPAGILELLRRYEILLAVNIAWCWVVVISWANRWLTLMMQKAYPGDCTVTVLPQSFREPEGNVLECRHYYCGIGCPRIPERRYGKRRGCNRGCGYDTCAGCNSQKRLLS